MSALLLSIFWRVTRGVNRALITRESAALKVLSLQAPGQVFLKNYRLNYRDFNIDQNYRDNIFPLNQTALTIA